MPIKGSKFCHFVYASQFRMIEVIGWISQAVARA
jgi:hypothetical protein